MLWCRSHLVWLVFEGSIPTCACFHSENFFVTCINSEAVVAEQQNLVSKLCNCQVPQSRITEWPLLYTYQPIIDKCKANSWSTTDEVATMVAESILTPGTKDVLTTVFAIWSLEYCNN